jgi:hypothetical protein
MIHIIGFISGIILLVAFYLLSNKKIDGQSFVYQGMTFFGALGIGLECFHNETWGAVFLQASCCVISAIVILKRLL